jgi:hypothetical protein
MTYTIMYLRHGKLVWDTNWALEIPPSCHFVRYGLQVHDADTAIVSDEDGYHLIVEERQKYDA